MFLPVSKYLPNVIFRNANINVQRANITGSMNWHNAAAYVNAPLLTRCLHPTSSELYVRIIQQNMDIEYNITVVGDRYVQVR